jgi:antitoxin component YwqK of YwqJK toxin-antitoxin module
VPGRKATRAALAAALALGASLAGAESLTVRGACRDGEAHGAWQLAAPDGKVRAIGAFAKGRRTGSFIFWNARGARIAHVPYEDEAKSGTLALWYDAAGREPAGPQRLEATYAHGRLHGVKRSWYRDGRLRAEYAYSEGRLVEAKAWDARGRPLPPDASRARAESDFASDEADYARLDALVEGHLPRCEAGASPKPR